MSENKVRLPKQLVDLIDDDRYYQECEQNHWRERFLLKVLKFEAALGDVPFELILQALVNGYEVEMTPEERIKVKFDSIEASGNYGYAYRKGITDTLDIFNIKISGVNAE